MAQYPARDFCRGLQKTSIGKLGFSFSIAQASQSGYGGTLQRAIEIKISSTKQLSSLSVQTTQTALSFEPSAEGLVDMCEDEESVSEQDSPPRRDMPNTELLWLEYFADPSQWWDKRKRKTNPKAPDFKHKFTKQSLWIDGWNNPSWIKDMFEEKCGRVDTLDDPPLCLSSDGMNTRLWEDYFMDPTMWWDNRKSKTNPRAPDFKNKVSKQSLWLGDSSNPWWVAFKLEEESRRQAMGETSSLVGSHMRPNGVDHSMLTEPVGNGNKGKFNFTRVAQADASRLETRDTSGWETLSTEEALACLEQRAKPPSVDNLIGILQKCRKKKSLVYAKRVHKYIRNNGLESHKMLGNYLVPMFVDCGGLHDAQQVFNRLVHRNEYSWSSLIHGYVESGEFQHVLGLYEKMHENYVHPSTYTFLSLLKACARLKSVERGRKIHSRTVATGCERDYLVGNTLVDMYAKFGSLAEAQEVLVKLLVRDVVSWTALIAGYADNGLGEEVSSCLERMQLEGVSPDAGTHVCSLKSFSNAGAIDKGREIHTQVIKGGYERDPLVGNILVDMYAKCGSLVEAWEVFNKMPGRSVVSWTALIAGHARRGECEKVFHLFEEMREEGVRPNDTTFLIVLSVCSHAGMVEKGSMYFEAMGKEYGITPGIKHHNCMLDLFSRAGQLSEAVLMLEKMPLPPNLVTWKTMLSACRKWGNVELARQAFEWAVRMKEKHASVFMLMSNIYADANMWEDLKKIEQMRVDMQAGEKLGKSWIEVGGVMHAFVEGDTRHSQSKDLHLKLKHIWVEIRKMQISDFESILPDMLDKEDALLGHCENLAIAFCLVNVLGGTPIRVVKNLWLRDQCHASVALISKVEHRTIFCRDASHFHVFKNGKCSCEGC